MSPPRILLITIHAARMPGSGGNVRAHFFIRTAASLGDVTLVALCGPGGHERVPEEVASVCKRVIEPSQFKGQAVQQAKSKSRLAAWLRTIRVLVFPWWNHWQDFLAYCVQHCAATRPDIDHSSGRPWKKFLPKMVQAEYNFLARWHCVPALTCAAYWSTFFYLYPHLKSVLQQEEFDAIWVEDVYAYPFAEIILRQPGNVRLPVICNSYNIETFVCERMANSAKDRFLRRYWHRESKSLRWMESRAYERSSLVFVCSQEDEQLGRQLVPAGNFQVVGNGVDLNYFQAMNSIAVAEQPTLLFTGTFGYGPNREALKYFVESVFPLIRKQQPDVRFVFAGAQAKEASLDFGLQDSAIECVSDPVDIRPCFRAAWVFVVPLLAGGGTRLKILEAMAMGVPVVSTHLGAEGLGCVHGDQLLMVDAKDPEGFADSVVCLLRNRELRNKRAQRAASWVKDHYDWQLLCQKAGAALLTNAIFVTAPGAAGES